MDSTVADHLPEANSLPDGFVDSSEVEKPSSDCDVMSIESRMESFDSSATANEVVQSSVILRPSPPSPRSSHLVNPSEMEMNHTDVSEEDSVCGPDCTGSTLATEARVDLEAKEGKERRQLQGGPGLKDAKLNRPSGIKCKPIKRNLKADKDLLEVTLKYQHVIAERDAAIVVRDKLESLCRELQRQNRTLMDECKRISVEGKNLREDLSAKFYDTIKGVSNKLEAQKDEYLAQLKENEMLQNKLKHLGDQYAISEDQFQQKLKQKTLELQLANLKLQQQQEKTAQEQAHVKLYSEQVSQLLATEKHLHSQLTADGEKFQQFQDALLKSNEAFETFKQEMEKMGDSIKELKKENSFLKSKCDKSDVSLIELVEEREVLKKQLDKVKNQKEKLESLCRSLQAERKRWAVAQTCDHTVELH